MVKVMPGEDAVQEMRLFDRLPEEVRRYLAHQDWPMRAADAWTLFQRGGMRSVR